MLKKVINTSCIILAFSFLIGCQSIPKDNDKLELAKWHYDHNEFDKAKPKLEKLADSGDSEALYLLAYMHYYGQGINENHIIAKELFTKSASNGHPLAKLVLRKTKFTDYVGKKKVLSKEIATQMTTKTKDLKSSSLEQALTSSVSTRVPSSLSRSISGADPKPFDLNNMYKKINNINPNFYSIQIISLKNEQRMKQLVAELGDDPDLYYYKTEKDGQERFVLIKGQYDTKLGAINEKTLLSPILSRWSPYVVQYRSIQDNIKKIA